MEQDHPDIMDDTNKPAPEETVDPDTSLEVAGPDQTVPEEAPSVADGRPSADDPSGQQEDTTPELKLAGTEPFPDGTTPDLIVEAVLFSSDSPMPASRIASVIGVLSSREIRAIVERLNDKYAQANCSFRIEEIAGGFQMMTRPEFSNYLQQLYKVRSESKLSPAALETLAIVAYKQPVLRAEIEAIRGVACGEVLRSLMEKDLVKIVGRAEELGRPMLYGTTKRFMQVFGLASLEDLPKVPELLPPKRPEPKEPPPAEPAPVEPAASE